MRNWNEEVIRPVGNALTQSGGIAVLRGNLAPGRGGAQALGRVGAPDAAPRAGGRLRGHRRLQGADRGRGARHRRELRHGAEELRTARLSRHGRGRQHAASAQGAAQGDHRHGAHLGRAHVRHRLRHGGAARRARGGARRPAGGGGDRRHDRARRAGAAAASRHLRRRARPAPRRLEAARRAAGRGLPADLHDHVGGADTGADLDFLKGCRGSAVARESH